MHAIKVLRLQKNDEILILDGKGKSIVAAITDPHPKKCKVVFTDEIGTEKAPKFSLHIAIAPTKNIDRFEWFVEKATELGIQEISPIICAQSERKILNIERIQKILVSAMKQSQSLYLPMLNEVVSFSRFIETEKKSDHKKLIAHCENDNTKTEIQVQLLNSNCTILIGPEGDFNKTEIELALINNFEAITLGNSRLRTETAGVYVASTFRLLNSGTN